ncbi:hypothetical protein BKA66DRAFT_214474 [Pyrenochaeta sp. MPI-SDFR-AT-0127]|nr:hypothetical protein BKA66DRAFT_214474 [Pyrenochaeta sp. MPI-SDFR-AT-0127]
MALLLVCFLSTSILIPRLLVLPVGCSNHFLILPRWSRSKCVVSKHPSMPMCVKCGPKPDFPWNMTLLLLARLPYASFLQSTVERLTRRGHLSQTRRHPPFHPMHMQQSQFYCTLTPSQDPC